MTRCRATGMSGSGVGDARDRAGSSSCSRSRTCCGPCIEFYHDNVGVSWGWSIVLLTVTVRIAILPLTIKQFRSMAAMQRIQPKVKALQNQYKGKSDPEAKKQSRRS